MLVRNVVVTTAGAKGMEVRIGLSGEGQAVQVYTWREPLSAEVQKGRGKVDGEDAAELCREEQEKEKRQKEAAAEGLDMLGHRRDRGDLLQERAQRLSGKDSTWEKCLNRKSRGAARTGRKH